MFSMEPVRPLSSKSPPERFEVSQHPIGPAVSTREAARFLGFSCAALKKWRAKGTGPRFVRVGRSIRYRIGDLLDWQQRHVV